MRSRLLLAVVAVIAVSAILDAQNPTAPKPRLATKVFSVADLVIPIPGTVQVGGERTQEPKKPLLSEKLMQGVTEMVRPYSWQANGGPGKLEFFEKGYALSVTNTAEALDEVRDLLETLRRLQDTNIVFEVRAVTIPADLAFGDSLSKEGEVTFMTDAQLKSAYTAMQADRRANVMQAPKVTTFDGQEAVVKCTEQQSFVTSLEAQRVKGQPVLVGKSTMVELGTTMTLRGQASADKKFVAVNVSYTDKRVEGNIPLIPVTTQITPIFEGGSQGKPVPFTQFLQSPQFETVKIEKKDLRIASGGSAVIPGPTFLQETRQENRIPVLAEIPYVNRLFRNVSYSKTTMRTLLVVTPQVIDAADVAPKR